MKVKVTKTRLNMAYAEEYVQLSDGTTVKKGEETEVSSEQYDELKSMKGVTVQTTEPTPTTTRPSGTSG